MRRHIGADIVLCIVNLARSTSLHGSNRPRVFLNLLQILSFLVSQLFIIKVFLALKNKKTGFLSS